MPLRFHSLKIATVRIETDSAVQIGFRIPAEKKEEFLYEPGQYLTISLTINGNKVRRAYSICSATHDPIISILVKRVDQGLVSNYLNDTVKVGDVFEVLPPNGHFKLTPTENKKHHYYFLGAGSGITPLISMISSILEREPLSHCYLLYGNRNEDNIIFRDKLDRLELVYNDRFKLEYLLSQPKKAKPKGWLSFWKFEKINWKGKIGKINNYEISQFFRQTNNSNIRTDGYFICGPGPMIETTYNVLLDLNIGKELVHREYFSAPIDTSADSELDVVERPQVTAKVKVFLDGKAIDVDMNDNTDIVQALLDKGVEPPYSCLSGTCSTCIAKLEKGKVSMDVTIGLEDDERENGFILTCQSHPMTKDVVINYDYN